MGDKKDNQVQNEREYRFLSTSFINTRKYIINLNVKHTVHT